ncbi:flagellar basal-body rod protein FlgG [Clostridium tetanomorphum]|uniref:Flagellar basal body rod protein FlgG n=1 Tax=Clostridium tetanomorphum TaxID=1553 RepID=A0A923E566_CLOTT|nr:flagellar hook-basal body complex protein [Clostridium tetanomorphum]MBC2396662.1 flagellar basal body rod protein FlgG [Clostridium tetanomorphum]MBP1866127.1 flagellar basal-body rod protein FlgG [Clostridium tetanomorphum]NRS85106.1 flagellar basal-body rod protein FlgG [Clostridium tetanomorphum]NRZ98288.1 flagellar basal-body rod protein FlgG [Clostridium tetanomorphum]SQC03189.1 flagellar basal body rod protein FlgG [Clostridium tetanomorphum]
MLRILWNGRSAMMAQQDKLDCISQNMANVNTEGYKKVEVSFKDLMTETLDRRGYPVNKGDNKNLITGTGVRTGAWMRNNDKGSLINTGVSTDLAIDGKGYFRVRNSKGETRYIRSGSFNIDNNGDLVDKNGNRLVIQYKEDIEEIPKFTKDNLIIKDDGTIFIKESSPSGSISKEVGKINVYSAIGDDSFLSVGDNLYMPENGVNPTIINSGIVQGYVEGSNVDASKEMTDMIMAQRAFEFGSKAVKAADEMWSIVNNMRGK